MKRLLKREVWIASSIVVATAMIAWILFARAHTSVGFRCGLLPAKNDPYLDGSGRALQNCDWHLGNGKRTWGETYGLKLKRVYVSVDVTHTNPNVTVVEAGEDN